MPVRRTIPYSSGTFFITFTCKNWIPIIELSKGYDIVYHWLALLREKGHKINGFVIMPNHVHVLITFKDSSANINTIVGNGKRFMAYAFVKRFKEQNKCNILKRLHESVDPERKQKNKLHDIWEYSFDWKNCVADWFKYQKLHYIHANPCSGKWQLASTPEKYLHSSASFYANGEEGVFPVDHLESMKDS